MYSQISPNMQRVMGFGFWLLMFWSLFSVAAPYTILPAAIPYTKELFLFIVLMVSSLLYGGLTPLRELSWPFALFNVMIFIYLPATFLAIGITYESTVYLEKYLQAPLAILAAANMPRLSGISLERWVNWYYKGAFFLIVMNFIGFFAPSMLMLSYNRSNYPSRITLGQPTPVAYNISLAFLYCLIILPFTHKRAVLAFILLFGVLVIVPGTTIASLAAILALLFLFRRRLSSGNAKRFLYFSLCVLGIVVVLIFLMQSTDPAVKYFVWLLELKVSGILGLVDDPSLGMRQARFDFTLLNFGHLIWFGTGLNSYVQFTSQMITHSVSMEHGFKAILVNFGVIGLALYLLYFLKEFWVAFRYGNGSPYSLLHMAILLNYLLHHFSIDVPYAYNMVVPTFFFQEYCKRNYLHEAGKT